MCGFAGEHPDHLGGGLDQFRGNAGRNCQTSELGPDEPDQIWWDGRSSIVAWQPVTAGTSFGTGRMCGLSADLTSRWSIAVQNINAAGPAIGEDGTPVLAGIGASIRASRTDRCTDDYDGDGFLAGGDSDPFVQAFEADC